MQYKTNVAGWWFHAKELFMYFFLVLPRSLIVKCIFVIYFNVYELKFFTRVFVGGIGVRIWSPIFHHGLGTFIYSQTILVHRTEVVVTNLKIFWTESLFPFQLISPAVAKGLGPAWSLHWYTERKWWLSRWTTDNLWIYRIPVPNGLSKV